MARFRPWFVCVCVLAAGMLSAAQSSSANGDWIALGPEGGDVRSLAYDPHDLSRVFLGTSAGELYLSTDGGANWSRFAHLGTGNDYVLDHIVVDPTDVNTMFVAAWSIENSGGDVFRSRDGGRTWQALPGMHGKSIRSFAMFSRDSHVLVAGALDGIFRSSDSGDTWERISPANHAEIKNIESIAIDPRSPDVIYAGTWHLPWKTLDGGRTWTPMKQGIIDDSDVFSIIIDHQNPAIVYLSACSGIYKSENGGELFHKVQGIPFSARRTRVLRQDPVNPAIVYAGTTEGLWETDDAGKTWRRGDTRNLIVNDVLVDPRQPLRLLLATDRSGVLASNDAGLTTRASNHGFSHRQVTAVLADAHDPGTLYAGVINDKEFGGVFVTQDGGQRWRQMNGGLAGDDIFTLAQSAEGDLLAGTQRGVYVFDRKAGRWRAINTVLTERTVTVTRSHKSGKGKRATVRRYLKSEFHARAARIVVSGGRWFAATSTGVYVSHNRGLSWRGGPLSGERDFFSVDVRGDRVLACTPTSLWLSGDSGETWKQVAVPRFAGTINAVALSPGAMWIASRAGVFSSGDKGDTWEHALVGLPAQNLITIQYDATARRLLGVTASGAIYASADGQSWSRAAAFGVPLRSVTFSGGRLLGITPFSGIVARAYAEAEGARVAAAGGSQP